MKKRSLTVCALVLAGLTLLAQQPPAAAPAQPPPAAAPAQPPPAVAPPQPPPTQPAQPAVTVPGAFNFSGASLIEVINILAGELHINYIIDPSVKGGTVTLNTFGTVRDVDIRPLLETILRMNNLAMVQVGNIFRIIPAANISHQPVSPTMQTDGSKLPDDERLVLNLVFLRYVSSSEMYKVLQQYMGDGAQLTSYDPANLLIILDNSRNMRRTLDLIEVFDNDAFAGQRVRAFDIRNGRPSDISRELDDIFKAYSLSGDKGSSPVHFIPVNRINTILAVAPNPGSFAQVENWIQKLDIPAKVTVGSVDNYVYKLKYAKTEVIGSVISQLYGGCGFSSSGMYGAATGNSSYPASGAAIGAPIGGGGYGGGGAYPYGGSSPYGSGGYPGGGYPNGGYPNGGNGAGGYPGGGYSGAGGLPCFNQAGAVTPVAAAPPAVLSTPAGAAPTGTTPATQAATDQTGSYLTASSASGRVGGPRIVPNPFDNTLLVQGTPTEWEQIRHLLEQLDIPPRQVLIDAKIYEVDLTGDFALGVESFLQKRGAANSSVPAQQLLGNVSGTGLLTLTGGILVGQSRQLLALLTANETNTKSKVLSAPSIIATDSIPASITVGSSVPTLSSEAVSPGVTVGGTSQFTNTISNTSTGIGLNILARVNPSGVVTMVINQNVTAPIPNPLSASGASGSDINSPSFSQRNVSTQVTVEDGDTIAIGGIMMDSTTETTSGIPYLSRLPYIGAVFGTKTKTTDRTELIIFLTPRVIYDTTQITDATDELKQKLRGLSKLMKSE
jgi:general secretion pathway protein D